MCTQSHLCSGILLEIGAAFNNTTTPALRQYISNWPSHIQPGDEDALSLRSIVQICKGNILHHHKLLYISILSIYFRKRITKQELWILSDGRGPLTVSNIISYFWHHHPQTNFECTVWIVCCPLACACLLLCKPQLVDVPTTTSFTMDPIAGFRI